MKIRRGFTLIELLVVMAIIGVVVAVLLPALVGARAACRRVHCVNNLKQLELAIQSYVTAYEVLPSGTTSDSRPVTSEPGGYKLSWIVSILPYMEQTMLSQSFDPDYGAEDPVNQTARMAWINSLLCPSEGLPEDPAGTISMPAMARGNPARISFLSSTSPALARTGPGRTSYVACHDDIEAPIDVDNHGAFSLNSHTRLVEVSDGLSNTVFLGEVPWSLSPGWAVGTRSTLRNTGHPINGVSDGSVPITGANEPRLPVPQSLMQLDYEIDSGELIVAPTFVGGFGSSHAGGGSNFAFGDGSVRFLKQTIDRTVFQRLGNRCDGEMIDDEAY